MYETGANDTLVRNAHLTFQIIIGKFVYKTALILDGTTLLLRVLLK